MRFTTGSTLPLAALVLALTAPAASAQTITLSVAPTYQQSVMTIGAGVPDPLLGAERFHAWGLMAGLERPNRFWQPHLWVQYYQFGQTCTQRPDVGHCQVDGWAVSVGPGFEVVETPGMSATFLTQVGLQGRSRAFTGGVGFHVEVRVHSMTPQAFAGYQIIRGVHYGTVGVGLSFETPLRRE